MQANAIAREELRIPHQAGRRSKNELREALHKAAYITNLRLSYTLMESDQLKLCGHQQLQR